MVIIIILSSTIFVVVSRILSAGTVSTAVLMQHCTGFLPLLLRVQCLWLQLH